MGELRRTSASKGCRNSAALLSPLLPKRPAKRSVVLAPNAVVFSAAGSVMEGEGDGDGVAGDGGDGDGDARVILPASSDAPCGYAAPTADAPLSAPSPAAAAAAAFPALASAAVAAALFRDVRPPDAAPLVDPKRVTRRAGGCTCADTAAVAAVAVACEPEPLLALTRRGTAGGGTICRC